MHESHRFAPVLDGVPDRIAHQSLGPEDRDGLDANARIFANSLLAALQHLVVQKADQLLRVGRSFFKLNAGIHVFGVLAEDYDVQLLRPLYRARHARVVLHRTHACVEVHDLPQSHVERANAPAHRRCQRAFDRNAKIGRGFTESSGSQFLNSRKAFSPAKISNHFTARFPP